MGLNILGKYSKQRSFRLCYIHVYSEILFPDNYVVLASEMESLYSKSKYPFSVYL